MGKVKYYKPYMIASRQRNNTKAFAHLPASSKTRLPMQDHLELSVFAKLAKLYQHFDYCSPVWDGLSGCLSDKLQKLQNRAARVITQSPFDMSSNLLLAMLKWEKLSLRRKKQKALIMYKTLNELAPD